MAYVYANLILNGKKTIDQVPKKLLEEVKRIIGLSNQTDVAT